MTGKEGCEVIAGVVEKMRDICFKECDNMESGLVITTDYLDYRRYLFVTNLFTEGVAQLSEAMKVARLSDEDFIRLDNAVKDENEVED